MPANSSEENRLSLTKRVTNRIPRRLRELRFFGGKAASSSPRIAFCPFCGAVLSDSFEMGGLCPQCNERIETTSGTIPTDEATPQVRALNRTILKYAERGFYVVRQKRDFAEMRKPKRFSPGWAAAWFIAGIPLPGVAPLYAVGYAAWHVLKREEHVVILSDADGNVRVEKAE